MFAVRSVVDIRENSTVRRERFDTVGPAGHVCSPDWVTGDALLAVDAEQNNSIVIRYYNVRNDGYTSWM